MRLPSRDVAASAAIEATNLIRPEWPEPVRPGGLCTGGAPSPEVIEQRALVDRMRGRPVYSHRQMLFVAPSGFGGGGREVVDQADEKRLDQKGGESPKTVARNSCSVDLPGAGCRSAALCTVLAIHGNNPEPACELLMNHLWEGTVSRRR